MKIKTSELIGAALDWAVAKAENMVMDKPAPGRGSIWFKTGIWTQPGVGGEQQSYCLHSEYRKYADQCDGPFLGFTKVWQPTVNWAQGGPIIEREKMDVGWNFGGEDWESRNFHTDEMATSYGPTPLIAAMRCYVASKLGDEVEIPEELLK